MKLRLLRFKLIYSQVAEDDPHQIVDHMRALSDKSSAEVWEVVRTPAAFVLISPVTKTHAHMMSPVVIKSG